MFPLSGGESNMDEIGRRVFAGGTFENYAVF